MQEPQKGWYQVDVVPAYEICEAVTGGRDLQQQWTRERLVFKVSVARFSHAMGFNAITILGFGMLLDLTRFTTHFSIDPDFGSGFYAFSCAS